MFASMIARGQREAKTELPKDAEVVLVNLPIAEASLRGASVLITDYPGGPRRFRCTQDGRGLWFWTEVSGNLVQRQQQQRAA